MPYPQFDRRQLEIKSLSERVHDMTLDHLIKLGDPIPPVDDPALPKIAEHIVHARQAWLKGLSPKVQGFVHFQDSIIRFQDIALA